MSTTEHFWRVDPEKASAADAIHAGMDRRALRTRQALHQALIGLILERDYDGISVADITQAANVGRSTFYAHFTDKDDLLRAGADSLRAILLHEHSSEVAGEHRPESRPLGFSRFMTAHLADQLPLYRALMRGRAGAIITEQIRHYIAEIVRAGLAEGDRKAPELVVQFVVGAYMSVLTWWLDRGAKEPAEEIDRAFRALAQHSLRGVLDSRSGALDDP